MATRLKSDLYEYLDGNVFGSCIFFSESETIYIIRVRAKNRKGQGLEALERVTIPRLSK